MPELADLAQSIVAAGRSGEQIEAYVAWHRETDIRAYDGEVEQLASAETAGIGVRVVLGSRQGFAYVGELDQRRGVEALAEARDNATFASPDEHVGLAEPDGAEPASLELWRDGVATLPTTEKVALALALERAVRSGDPRIRQVTAADYGDSQSESAIATSTGIVAMSRRTGCYVAASALAGSAEETQSGTGYSVGRDPTELDVAVAAQDAIERATRLLGARKTRSRRLTVVFDRRVTATLLAILSGTLSGEDVAKGRSLFAGRLGERVAVDELTLVEDPTNPLAYGASVYDAEGLACRRTPLIAGGRLASYLYDTYSARLAGATSTASAVRAGFKSGPGVGARALAIDPGDKNQDEIVAAVGEGFLVQSITGVHSGVNPVSGDFSVGAEGLLISGGALGAPVREVTIASTIQRMLQGVLHIGADVEWLPGSAAGVSLAVGDIALSGE